MKEHMMNWVCVSIEEVQAKKQHVNLFNLTAVMNFKSALAARHTEVNRRKIHINLEINEQSTL